MIAEVRGTVASFLFRGRSKICSAHRIDFPFAFAISQQTYADGKAETVMGEAIKMGIDKGTWERDDLVVTSKYFFGYKVAKISRKVQNERETVFAHAICLPPFF